MGLLLEKTIMRHVNYSINRPLKGITVSWWIGVSEEGSNTCEPIAYIHPSKGADKELLQIIMENIVNQRV
jgi:hypothetical protein